MARLEAPAYRPVHHPRTERLVEFSHPAFVGFACCEIHDAHPAGDGIERLPVVQDLRILTRRRGVELHGITSQAVDDDNIPWL